MKDKGVAWEDVRRNPLAARNSCQREPKHLSILGYDGGHFFMILKGQERTKTLCFRYLSSFVGDIWDAKGENKAVDDARRLS